MLMKLLPELQTSSWGCQHPQFWVWPRSRTSSSIHLRLPSTCSIDAPSRSCLKFQHILEDSQDFPCGCYELKNKTADNKGALYRPVVPNRGAAKYWINYLLKFFLLLRVPQIVILAR